MEDIENSRILKILLVIFAAVSIIHVLYASFTFRGMYCDGAFYMLKMLNQFSSGAFPAAYDPEHPRFIVLMLTQLPVIAAHSVLFIKNKFALMFIYSFSQFAIPLFALYWHWLLAARTKKYDIFFWNLFTYAGVLLTFEIFSVTESIQGTPFLFILWNYLAAEMEYTKKDIISIVFLLGLMFGIYEYTAYLGILFFLFHFHYVLEDKSVKNQAVKTLIGFGSLAASIYTIWFLLKAEGEGGEILRFIEEGLNTIPLALQFNTLITITAAVMIIICTFKKSKLHYAEVFSGALILSAAFFYSAVNLDASLIPMREVHLRTLPCIFLPAVFIVMHIQNLMHKEYNPARVHNFICFALLCAVFQTCWQYIDTYYWNKNIQYMKEELNQTDELLYTAGNHPEISSFMNEHYRRYIWHGIYAVTSIIFSDSYKQKTLLVNYDEPYEEGNGTYRNRLYIPEEAGKISLPFGFYADIKNDYWDLTDCAQALDNYNKEHNIQTGG